MFNYVRPLEGANSEDQLYTLSQNCKDTKGLQNFKDIKTGIGWTGVTQQDW